jgi:hypothetical protein
VAEAAGAPRIVKVLARQQGCCEHGHHAVKKPGTNAAEAAGPARPQPARRPS